MALAIGILAYNRPIHTALTLAFALRNKSPETSLHVFYGTHRHDTPPSQALDRLLKNARNHGLAHLHYLHEDKPNNTGGSVDTLMMTLNSLDGVDCYFKIDDDVLIGPGTDRILKNLLLELENEKVYLLMGQAVRHHLNHPHAFCWEKICGNHLVIQRSNGGCPMETYTAVSTKFLNLLKINKRSISCEDAKGTFMPFARKVFQLGGRAALVLKPAIVMQHIGLCSLIAGGAERSWSPATSWENPHTPIEVPGFDFKEWANSHNTGTQKVFGLKTILGLAETCGNKEVFLNLAADLDLYDPARDVPLPKGQVQNKKLHVIRRGDKTNLNRVVIPPTLVRRVIVKAPGKIVTN